MTRSLITSSYCIPSSFVRTGTSRIITNIFLPAYVTGAVPEAAISALFLPAYFKYKAYKYLL